MGIYNDYYKKYYMDVKGQGNPKEYKSGNQYKQHSNSANNIKHEKGYGYFPIFINIFSRRFATIFTIQTFVVVVLFLTVIGSKLYPTSMVADVYGKAVSYIDTGILKNKQIDNADVVAVFNEIKSLFEIEEREESYIKENYSMPVDVNNVSKVTVVEDKLLLNFKDEAYIRSAYSGTVKEVQESDGISLLIDHGNGIEIKYMGIEDCSLSKGDKVDKGSIVGSLSNNSNSTATIEIYYMGSRLNPSKCFDFEKI